MMSTTPPCYASNWLLYLYHLRQDTNAMNTIISTLPPAQRDDRLIHSLKGLGAKYNGKLDESTAELAFVRDPIDGKSVNIADDDQSSAAETDSSNQSRTSSSADSELVYLRIEQGLALSMDSLYSQAAEAMQRLPMLSSARTGWKAQYLKATLQEQDASIGAAKDTLTSLLSSCHEDVVYLSLASLWSRTGAGQQVKDIIEQALQRQPNNNELLDVLIASLLEHENLDAAFRHLAPSGQSGAPRQLSYLGSLKFSYALERIADSSGALKMSKMAAVLSAFSSGAWNNIGVILTGNRKQVTGIGCLRLARSLSITEWPVLHNLGLMHLRMGLYASATVYLSAAHRFGGSQNAATLLLLSIAIHYLGNESQAKLLARSATVLLKHDQPMVFLYLIPQLLLLGNLSGAQRVHAIMRECLETWTEERRLDDGMKKLIIVLDNAMQQSSTTTESDG